MVYRGDHPLSAREVALAVLLSDRHVSIDERISRALEGISLSSRDRQLTTELVYGTLRWRGRLDYYLRRWFQGDFRRADRSLQNILRLGLYQLLYLDRVPDHAAVDSSVTLAKGRLGEKPARLVNAILRRAIREKDKLPEPDARNLLESLAIRTSHPHWLVKRWVERFGWDGAETYCQMNNRAPGLWVRWNRLQTDLDSFLALLDEQGMAAETPPVSPWHVLLKDRVHVGDWQPLRDGLCTVQDVSAGFPVQLLDPQPGEVILDYCAAPGGKTTQIAESIGDQGVVVAQDVSPVRMRKVGEHVERMGLSSVQCLSGDGCCFHSESFDRILLDVPCSGLGVIQRRPDIRWNRTLEEIKHIISVQRTILERASELVKPSGVMVYSTCTTEPEENWELVDGFLSDHSEWIRDDARQWVDGGVVNPRGEVETIPHIHNMDGSYAVRLVRK